MKWVLQNGRQRGVKNFQKIVRMVYERLLTEIFNSQILDIRLEDHVQLAVCNYLMRIGNPLIQE